LERKQKENNEFMQINHNKTSLIEEMKNELSKQKELEQRCSLLTSEVDRLLICLRAK
jgi:uncharacterized small protein (DUF1192 family)